MVPKIDIVTFRSELWNTRPAVRVVLLVCLGILLSGFIHIPLSILSWTVPGTVVTFILFTRYVKSTGWGEIWFPILFLLVGLWRGTARQLDVENDILSPLHRGERILVEGRVESKPSAKGSRWDMMVETDELCRDSANLTVNRHLLVSVMKSAEWKNPDSLRLGDIVRIDGILESLPGARNPGEFDYGRYLALNGVQGFVTVHDSGAVVLKSRTGRLALSNFLGTAQGDIYGIFDRFHHAEEASFLKGVVFGFRGDLSAELKQSFMDTGTIHILAVSGSNVVVVALMFSSLIGFFRVSTRIATALTIVGLLWYMFITGLSPSVIRATIMGCVILVGTLFERKGEIYNSLAVAALVMLAWDPLYLFDVGFQLSFAAVLSIVCLYPRLDTLIGLLPSESGIVRWLIPALKLFAVSLAAQIGTLPFTAYYFGRVSLVAVFANLIVVPVSGMNTLLGFATLGSSFLADGLASCYAALNDLLVSLLLRFVTWSAKVPYAYVETLGVGKMFTALYYLAVAAVFTIHVRGAVSKILIVGLGVVVLGVYVQVLGPRDRELTLTAIDVGQGDAMLLELPNRARILIDTGPALLSTDAGRATVAPLLARKGIRALDAIVLTHAHDDHIGGCKYLLDNFHVGSLVVPDTAAVTEMFTEVLGEARKRGVEIRMIHGGDRLQFDPSTRIFVLNPVGSETSDDLNDQSVVLKVVYGASTLLLTGDASHLIEDRFNRSDAGILSSEVLKVAHHGSLTASGERFLIAVRPSAAIVSVAAVNKFRHPSPIIIGRLRKLGIAVLRTDLEGAIILQSDGRTFRKIPWRRKGLL